MPFELIHLPLSSKWFNRLVIDYIHKNQDVSPLYSYFPGIEGFQHTLQDIKKKSYDRNTLVQVLWEQAKLVENTSEKTLEHIHLLKQETTFTVTTGHQLCLFTGPLYVIYKISAAIQLSEDLKKLFPHYNFVTVFWMATEDHDAEEINHFYFDDKKFQWHVSTDGTPVGLLETSALSQVLEEIKSSNLFAEEEIQLFTDAYLKHGNLSDATRFLINHLFGDKGIVILDPSDSQLKKIFTQNFFNDVFSNEIFHQTQSTIEYLKQRHYPVQANPLLINTFFIHNHKRYLIQKENNVFRLKNTNTFFSEEELKKQIQNHSENFSPNVLLRPLYQQKILPNIAYIGGAAEIAYWLLLKQAFISQEILYPIIIQRPSFLIIPNFADKKIKKLNITFEDILNDTKENLIYKVLEKQQLSTHFESQKEQIKNVFSELLQQTQHIDKSLIPFVNAELTKTMKFLDTLEHKLNRSIKQKNDTLVNHLESIYHTLLPQNTMQDRIWNIAFARHSLNIDGLKNFVDEILPHCQISLNNYKPLKILIQK